MAFPLAPPAARSPLASRAVSERGGGADTCICVRGFAAYHPAFKTRLCLPGRAADKQRMILKSAPTRLLTGFCTS